MKKLTKLTVNLKNNKIQLIRGLPKVLEISKPSSYVASPLIAKRMKPFIDGKFVKECLMAVAIIVCPEKGQFLRT